MSDGKHVFRFLVYIMFPYMLKCSNVVEIEQTVLMKVRTQVCQSPHEMFVQYALHRHRQPSWRRRKARRKGSAKASVLHTGRSWQSHVHKAVAFPHAWYFSAIEYNVLKNRMFPGNVHCAHPRCANLEVLLSFPLDVNFTCFVLCFLLISILYNKRPGFPAPWKCHAGVNKNT